MKSDKITWGMVLLLTVLSFFATVNAQDTPATTTTENVETNENANTFSGDNVCYDTENFDCTTLAQWDCGWHYAEWLANGGDIGTYAYPPACNTILPRKADDLEATAIDNACHRNGSLYDKCDTDWAWQCGWYLQQWENAGGWQGTYTMPSWCVTVLPPRPAPVVINGVVVTTEAVPATTCTIVDDDAGTLTIPLAIINGNDPNGVPAINVMTNSPSGFDWVDIAGDTTLLYDKSGDGSSGGGDDSIYTESNGWGGDVLSTNCPMPTLPF